MLEVSSDVGATVIVGIGSSSSSFTVTQGGDPSLEVDVTVVSAASVTQGGVSSVVIDVNAIDFAGVSVRVGRSPTINGASSRGSSSVSVSSAPFSASPSVPVTAGLVVVAVAPREMVFVAYEDELDVVVVATADDTKQGGG